MIAGYLARDTFLHRVSAKVKLIGLALIGVMFAFVSPLWMSSAALVTTLIVYLFCGKEVVQRLAAMRGLLLMLLVIGIIQTIAIGWEAGLTAVTRLLVMILLADLVTLSTTMQDMMAALQPLLRPFRRWGVDPHRVSLAVALVLRFIPYLVANWRARDEAYRARTGKSGGWRIIAPFIIETMNLADKVTETLNARGLGIDLDKP